MTRATAPSLRLSVIAMAITLFVGLAFAVVAHADDMNGMNMTDDQMQNMPQTDPTAAPATDMSGNQAPGETSGHDGMVGMPGMDGSDVSTNWLVVGAFLALIAGGTAAAVVVKRRLHNKMLAGDLATAGVLDA